MIENSPRCSMIHLLRLGKETEPMRLLHHICEQPMKLPSMYPGLLKNLGEAEYPRMDAAVKQISWIFGDN